jgi:hypothetical protein
VAIRLPLFLEFSLDLNLVHIVFEISRDEPVSLIQQLYDAVRGFEKYFKSCSCTQNDLPCQLCRDLEACCPYRSVFGQLLSTDPGVVRRHQKPPLPFAFKIIETEQTTECTELGLVIAGKAIHHVSLFQSAVKLMIASVTENKGVDATVSGTWCLDYQGGRHELNAASYQLILFSSLEIIQATQHSKSVKIYLDSPLRLLCGGSIAHAFDFGLLLRSQLRRCSSFFAHFGEGELELDYVLLSQEAEKVTSPGNVFNFSKPQWALHARLGGILGAGEFTGLTDGMFPLLRLGSYLNAGKGAAYGLGAYRIESIPD